MEDILTPHRTSRDDGGTVEPLRTKHRSSASTSERYELRDPFNEVTHRARSLERIVAKADQLGSLRYVAIDPAGRRTVVEKVDGKWQRGRASLPAPKIDPPRGDKPARDRTPEKDTPSAVPKPAERGEQALRRARLEAALLERYVVKRSPMSIAGLTVGQTEYRFRGDVSRIAFTESASRLATDTNSPSVARSMVDLAEARQWKTVRVSGHDDFRRMVWLEASARGVRALGYEPLPADLDLLKRAREARSVNRIEPLPDPAAPTEAGKAAGRGSGGRPAVLAAIEAVLVAKGVPEPKRIAVLAAAGERLAERVRDGRAFQVEVYDRAASSRRPKVETMRTPERARERPTPAR